MDRLLNALTAATPESSFDLGLVHAAGWLHWLRFLALPDEERRRDGQEAMRYLSAVYLHEPRLVPDPLREQIRESVETARPGALINHAIMMVEQFLGTGDRGRIDRAIEVMRWAVELSGPTNPDYPAYLGNLSSALRYRSRVSATPAELAENAEASGAWAASLAPDAPEIAISTSFHGTDLYDLYRVTGEKRILDEAISTGRRAVALCAPHSPDRGRCLSHLAISVGARPGKTDTDVDEHLTLLRQAWTVDPANRLDHGGNLAQALLNAYRERRDPGLLEEFGSSGIGRRSACCRRAIRAAHACSTA